MKRKVFQRQKERRTGPSLLFKFFALMAFMLCGVNGVWGQDSEFGFSQTPNTTSMSMESPTWTGITGVTNSGNKAGSLMGYYSNKDAKYFYWSGDDAKFSSTTYWRTGGEETTYFSAEQWAGYELTVDNSGYLNISGVKARIMSEGSELTWGVQIIDNSGTVKYESSTYTLAKYAYDKELNVSNLNITNLTGTVKVRIYVYGGKTKYFTINDLKVTGSYHASSSSFDYSVVSKHDGTTLNTVTGTSSDGSDKTIHYPRYILSGTTLYGIPRNNSGDYWGTTLTSANTNKELNYSETVDGVVVYYTEGENISGVTTAENTARASNGYMGYTTTNDTYKEVTNLNRGVYKIVARGVNGNNATRNCNFKVGDNVVYNFQIPKGTDINGTSEFTVTSTKTLSFACDGSSISGLDYFYIVKTGEYTAPVGIHYNANGGTCERATDDRDEEITLPTATRDGYTFIGWMNNSTDITPTAGRAGDAYTSTEEKTLYALWYKNAYVIDFTTNGPFNGQADKAGATIDETSPKIVNGKAMGNITINGIAAPSNFVVQTGTSWLWRTGGGLYSFNNSNRAYGVTDCLQGQYITVVSDKDPNVQGSNATLVSNSGNTYVYEVTADGGVSFNPVKYSKLYSITVATPCPHYIYYNGNVGAADEERGWWQNFSQFYTISKGQTINFRFTAHDGNTDITNYHNWTFVSQAINKHNGDLGITNADNERLILQANGNSWFGYAGTAKYYKNDTEMTEEAWRTDINSAYSDDPVYDVKIQYSEAGIMTATATVTLNGDKYVVVRTSPTIPEDNLYMFFTAHGSWIEGITHPIYFENTNPSIVITANGSAQYYQSALGYPNGKVVTYSVVGTTGDVVATLNQESGSNEYQLTVRNRGTVTVKAVCDGHEATYTLTVDGIMFQYSTPTIAHHERSFTNTLLIDDPSGVNYEIVQHDTNISGASISTNNASVTVNIPENTEGGVVVVRATKGQGVAEFCLTVAYDLHVWNMYSDPLNYGTVVEGNKANHRPGSAHYVIWHDGGNYTYEYNGAQVTDGNRVRFNDWQDDVDVFALENWFNAQSGTKTQGTVTKDYDLLHRNWRFTYKICHYDNGVRTYVNEPLFAYKRSVVGDNARIIKETAGLRFETNPLSFGVSDNDVTNDEGGSVAVREQDRCVLMKAENAKLIIPRVKCGRYIRIHWYRHSDNNGDRCKIENGVDLDGREIDPNDIIRFTGSHYYDDHKGSFVFQVTDNPTTYYTDGDNAKCCDVVITPSVLGWTEIYRVEIMDKFDSEMQVCEVDVANTVVEPVAGSKQQVGDKYATTDVWNSKSLNNTDSYNRDVFDATKANHPVLASRLVSKIRTRAKAVEEGADVNAPLEYAPELYLSGYPGHCYTWNGWLNTTVQATFFGTASCTTETKSDANLTQENTIPSEPIWVGYRLKYTMHPLKNVKGEGTIKLTLRTHSGWDGEPHYTFDKQEAYVAVGQYSVQNYPYTWDFSNYNFGLNNAYNGKTYDVMGNNSVNAEKEYGYWYKDEGSSVWNMRSYHGNMTDKITRSGSGFHYLKDANKKINKPLFAQGAQLALGTVADMHTVLETEGLRINIPAVSTPNNHAVTLTPTAESTNLDEGYLTVSAGSKITIPEVDKDMYVFVKSDKAPAFSGTTNENMVSFERNRDNNVTYYKATGDADGNKADVVLTFGENTKVYKIGVTKEVKPIAYFGWATESRAVDIDYNETRYFSHNMDSYYITGIGGWNTRSDNFDITNDLEVKTEASSDKIINRKYIAQGTGIVLQDKEVIYDKNDKDNDKDICHYVPLFVPACNIPETSGPADDKTNYLVGSTNKDKEYTTIYTSIEGAADEYYTFNISYREVAREDNTYRSEEVFTDIPRFYRYVGAGGSTIQSRDLYNLAYLYFPTAGVKSFADFINVDFDSNGSATDVKSVNQEAEGTIYNLRGQAINGKPSARGIYIQNGKKYYVK